MIPLITLVTIACLHLLLLFGFGLSFPIIPPIDDSFVKGWGDFVLFSRIGSIVDR